ncbi:hypothetical protein BJ878DRAFT_499752 [Calycina marina]|uniref:Uncharacterized protein n=1 Tax=Calycina marina TaxID=1763456 RepID=A0A9P7Z577_9HELO|nr:hypothetical protein BJ878DRAFT_499752 [Calycina marina]
MAASFGIAKWKPPLTPGFDLEKLKRFTVEYENFMGKGLPVSWRNVGHFTYAHDNYWWNTYKAAKATKSAHNGKVAQANDIVQWVHRINSAAEMAKPHLDGIGAAPANSIRSQQNRLGLSQTTAKGMCGNLFGVTEDDNMMKMEELSAFIIQYIDDARYEIADAFDSIMKFDSSEPENAVLRLFMTEDRLASSADLSESTFRDLENQLQWDVEKYFIKELLASSRCYVECNVLYDDAKHFCPASGKAILEEEREHRFCPDKTHVCKAACLTKKQRYNKKLSVFGAKHLDKYDTSLKELLKNSWNHYNLHGSKSYEANLLFVNGTQTPTDDLFYLPVCYTKSDTIGRISLAKKYENRFPFACGRNYKSDDASEFLKDISVNLSKERYIRQKHLGWELTALHPANAYALMCNLDIHWPRRKNGYEPLWALTPGKERHCDQIRAETKHMDEFAANAHFCNKSKAASDAMDEEQTQKLTMPVQKVDNQRTKCKKFKKKYSILINLRAEAIEQKYSLYLQDQSASDMLLATIDLLTSEKEGLEAKLNDLSTTNPDLETISQLSKANAGFQKDLSALENNVSAGSPAGQNLQKLLGADLTETETEFEKLSAVNRDATEIWEAARRFSEIDEKLEVLKKERTELGMGGAKKPS